MTSRWADLDRPPLDEKALRAALIRPGSFVTDLRVVAETGSTNADLSGRARAGAPEGTVLVAETQTAGRGRLDRGWVSPARAGLTFSVLLRPAGPVARRTWLPLLTGLAVHDAVARLSLLPTALKWPNDVLLGTEDGAAPAKLAGILAQADGDAVVVGIGLNVSTRPDELPPGATSLAAAESACADRDPVLRAVLRALGDRYAEWTAGADLRPAYQAVCDTIGRDVRVQLPDGEVLTGPATGVDELGRLVVGDRAVSAGDVTRVRPITIG